MNELDIALIKKRSVHGVVVLTSRTFLLQIISFVTFILISSILPPNDFGIYTAVTNVRNFSYRGAAAKSNCRSL